MAMFRAIDGELGPIDALVNNAGIDYERLVADVERGGVERDFDVNVIGLILCCREAVRHMSHDHGGRGGTIVNVSSVAAHAHGGLPKDAVYTASKGAVDAFTRGLSNEVAGQGVRVGAVRRVSPSPRSSKVRWGRKGPASWHVERCRWAGSAGLRRSPRWSCGCARRRRAMSRASPTT